MEHIVKPIVGIQPNPQSTEVPRVSDPTIQPEKVKEDSPWTDAQVRIRHVQNSFAEGTPINDTELFRIAVDIFGLEEANSGPQNTRVIERLLDLVKKKFNDDPIEILEYLQRASREFSGTNKHKQLLRQLQISGFSTPETPEGKWELMREEYKMLKEKLDGIDKKISERKENKKVYG